MPILLSKQINADTQLAVWKIEEAESFFLQKVQLLQPLRHPHKRLQHLAGRYLLSQLYPAFPYHQLMINERRKPFLPSGEYHFSISHCADYAAVIISTCCVAGIDIELYSPKTEWVLHKFLDATELSYLNTIKAVFANEMPQQDYQLSTLCWSAKEAVYKWWGKGQIDFKKNIRIRKIDPAQIAFTFFSPKMTCL